ncbi:MAG: hypothetical protein ACTTJ7_07855, partial [Treponema sp.]
FESDKTASTKDTNFTRAIMQEATKKVAEKFTDDKIGTDNGKYGFFLAAEPNANSSEYIKNIKELDNNSNAAFNDEAAVKTGELIIYLAVFTDN